VVINGFLCNYLCGVELGVLSGYKRLEKNLGL
jgi:hypothetical protein